jgi:dipeptidyl aminopeptidase/acylaminoacyl peptidase
VKAVGHPSPLAQSTKPAFNPEPSPDGRWLTFTSLIRPEDIFIVGTDGRGLRQLTDDNHVDRFARWSPDGNLIAFQSDRSGKYQIWVIHEDGSGLRQITEEPEGVVAGPVWSPDGRRLAYNRSGDVPRIVDTGKPWREQTPDALPPHPKKQYWAYQWSSDGRMLIGWAQGSTVLYYVNERKYVEVISQEERYPVMLQDNRRLLFREKGAIQAMDIQTKKRYEVLSPAPLSRFSLSRDNRTIYYTRETSEADIWLMTLK